MSAKVTSPRFMAVRTYLRPQLFRAGSSAARLRVRAGGVGEQLPGVWIEPERLGFDCVATWELPRTRVEVDRRDRRQPRRRTRIRAGHELNRERPGQRT